MDLSKVLGDVYDSPGDQTAPARQRAGQVPQWADDAHLDEVFAGWTPGPPSDAPAKEREIVAPVMLPAGRRLDDDLAAALSAALSSDVAGQPTARFGLDLPGPATPVFDLDLPAPAADSFAPSAVPSVPVAPADVALDADVTDVTEVAGAGADAGETDAPGHRAGWRRGDDDVLVSATRGGRRGLSRRRGRR